MPASNETYTGTVTADHFFPEADLGSNNRYSNALGINTPPVLDKTSPVTHTISGAVNAYPGAGNNFVLRDTFGILGGKFLTQVETRVGKVSPDAYLFSGAKARRKADARNRPLPTWLAKLFN